MEQGVDQMDIHSLFLTFHILRRSWGTGCREGAILGAMTLVDKPVRLMRNCGACGVA